MSGGFVHSRVMPPTPRTVIALAFACTAAAAILAGGAGCGEHEAPPPAEAPAPPAAPPGSDWRQLPETVVLELSESDLEAFRDAAERARAAAASARERFTPAAPGEPDAWFVLVALPVAEGEGRETLWVAVDAWSEHRIEGRQVQLGQLTGIGRGLMEGDGGQAPAGLGDAAGAGVNADGVVAPA